MGDHELMHAAPAMYTGGGGGGGGAASHHGMWWNPAACSAEFAGFGTWPSALVAGSHGGGGRGDKRCAVARASCESPGNSSSITFQEPTGVPDPAAVPPPPALGGFTTDWNHPSMNCGGGDGDASLHRFLQGGGHQEDMISSRTDHQISHMDASSLMNLSSDSPDPALQGHHERPQLLPELLLSPPTSPDGFQSALLRSLVEPAARPAMAAELELEQYQLMVGQSSPAGARELLQFDNDAPFWSTSAGFAMAMAAAAAAATGPAGTLSPAPPAASLALKNINKKEQLPASKKARLETPSPLPTFKVRKEKLGDRVTALQQLVSPFGKTDSGSVLQETIQYINFLHHQLGVLGAPCRKNGHHRVPQHLKSSSVSPDHKSPSSSKDGEVSLKGRGLCLVPISSSFTVAGEVPFDFWTPFRANFR